MRIGEVLLKQGYVNEESIDRALRMQAETHRAIGEILIDIGAVSESTLHDALILQVNLKTERFEDTVVFLQNTMPFSLLAREELGEIASAMAWEHFSPGDMIIRQGVEGTKFYIIKSGLVKIDLDQEEKEVILGFLGEGDCFGEMSLLTNVPTTSNVETVEFTLCLVQNKEAFLEMMQRYPVFYTFFNQLLTHRMKTVYRELLTTTPGIAQVEPFLYRKQVKDFISQTQVFCDEATTIKDAARELVEKKANTIIVVNSENKAKGLLGSREIVKALMVEEKDASQPVSLIMEKEYFTVGADSYFFDALHEMVKHKTNKLVVTERGRIKGIITGFDLLKFRGREVLALIRNIEEAPDFPVLDTLRREVEKVLRALMADGALASNACKIVSEFNDKISRRVIRLVERQLGRPPVPYAWLGLGSEGRKEQTLLTDQDNGIVFAGSAGPDAEDYFRRFSEMVVNALNQCGFPLCKGNIMATNPKYFGRLNDWQGRIRKWIVEQELSEKDLVDIYVFLDFRAIYGNQLLEKELTSYMLKCIRENPSFLRSMAENIVSVPIPLGFFKNFIVEKNGKYKNTVNLKNYGLLPLTTCIKILGLHYGVDDTNTLERLKALQKHGAFSEENAEMFEQAFEILLTLKIKNNLNDIDEGKDFGNHLDPASLSNKQKQMLKESFWAITQLQKTTKSILNMGDEAPGFGS
jgi:CBS domain-containing protein